MVIPPELGGGALIDLIPAVSSLNRLAFFYLILSEVFRRNEAAAAL